MPRKINTEPMTIAELRRAWVERPEARDLLAEIHRLHCVLREINGIRRIVEDAYLQAGGGRLVAIHRFKVLLSNEPAIDRLYSDDGL